MNRQAAQPAQAWRGRTAWLAYGALTLLIAIAAALSPAFASATNVENLIAQSGALLLASLGQTFVMLSGGMDISVGAVVNLVTVVLSFVLMENGQLVPGVAAGLAVGLAVGAMNGWGVTRLRVHPFMMTLGTLTFVQGVVLLLRPSPGGAVAPLIGQIMTGNVAGVPMPAVWTALAVAGASWLLRHSRFGLHVFAVGGSSEHAFLSGVPVRRTLMLTYVLSGCTAGLAGLYMTGRILSGDPLVGQGLGLDSATAVVLGGTVLGGGRGSVGGTVAGVFILGILSNLLNLLNVSPFYQFALKGALLILAVGFHRERAQTV